MKPPAGQHSTKCVSSLAIRKAARKMGNKDGEAKEEQKREDQQPGTSEGAGQPAQRRKKDDGPSQQLPQGGESPHGILREGSYQSEESTSRRESRPHVQITDTPNVAQGSDTSLGTVTLTSMRSRPPSTQTHSTEESIEGELELDERETMGPTLGRYKYEMTKEGHQALSNSLREKTIKTLIHLGEIHKASYIDMRPPSMHQPLAPRLSQPSAETQLYLLDKELKAIRRRINESKREQAYTMKRINELEMKMFKDQGADYIRGILTKVPKEEDLKNIELIRQLMLERKQMEREIKKLNMEMTSMSKAISNADVIISDCAAIKKPRRVVICGWDSHMPREVSPSRDDIGRGTTMPPTTGDADESALSDFPTTSISLQGSVLTTQESNSQPDIAPQPEVTSVSDADQENEEGNSNEEERKEETNGSGKANNEEEEADNGKKS